MAEAPSFEIKMKFTPQKDGNLLFEQWAENAGKMQGRITRELYMTKDKLFRNALVDMGWTPPAYKEVGDE